MLKRCIFILFLTLPILGCKDELWRLEFDAPVRVDAPVALSNSSLEIKGQYLHDIQSILLKNNLDPVDFQFRHHQTVEGAIIVIGDRDSISQEAFAGVERDFQEVLAARNEGLFSAALEFSDDLKELTGSALWRQRYDFNYRIDQVTAYAYVPQLYHLISSIYGAIDEHDLFCAATAEITHTFPIDNVTFPTGSLSGQAVIREGEQYLTVPVRLEFADPALAALFQGSEAKVRIENLTRMGSTSMYLEFAALGNLSLRQVKSSALDEMCAQEALKLGRPFSFLYGEGLDRLVRFRTL